MTMADEHCMIDTNVLIYSTVEGNPWYEEARRWLNDIQSDGTSLYITTQIYREYRCCPHTRRGLQVNIHARRGTRYPQCPEFLSDGARRVETDIFRDLVQRYQVKGKSFHDASIVAVMLNQSLRRLATYNRNDFKRYREITLEPLPTAMESSTP